MATKNEKTSLSIIGLLIGSYYGYKRYKELGLPQEELWKFKLRGGIIGGAIGFTSANIFGSPNDTVNYTHYLNGKRVYEGVTYAHRFYQRMAEHRASGKKFTTVVKDTPKPRVEALALEKKRIKKFKPVNNIIHNER